MLYLLPEFVGTCVDLEADFIHALDENAKEITYRTFTKYFKGFRRFVIEDLGMKIYKTLSLKNDWSISYEKSRVDGKDYIIMHHSAIHHVFLLQKGGGVK